MDTKFCRDCRYYQEYSRRRTWYGLRYEFESPMCGHVYALSLVTGRSNHTCKNMREGNNVCGLLGKLWEPKNDKERVFYLLKRENND